MAHPLPLHGVTRNGAARTLRPAFRATALPRPALLLAIICGAAAGLLATSPQEAAAAIAQAGPELTRLLRAMAALKLLSAAAAWCATLWRLQAPIAARRLIAHLIASACMAAGPALIWQMDHVAAGALLLHAGLLAAIVLLWRDPATAGLFGRRLDRREGRQAVLF